MSYIVQENHVEVIGKGWYGQSIAYRYEVDHWQLESIQKVAKDEYENLTLDDWREIMQDWIDTHAGDFMHIEDFRAVLDNFGVVVEWKDENSEYIYFDMMYPELAEGLDN